MIMFDFFIDVECVLHGEWCFISCMKLQGVLPKSNPAAAQIGQTQPQLKFLCFDSFPGRYTCDKVPFFSNAHTFTRRIRGVRIKTPIFVKHTFQINMITRWFLRADKF